MLSYSLSLRQVEPTPHSEKRASITEAQHEHVDCLPDQRKWLERKHDQAATMKPYAYCVVCGKVKNIEEPRARKLGFYIGGLLALREHLETHAFYGKMTQSQTRLITKALKEVEDFEDPYGLSMEAQTGLFVDVVRRVRPDLGAALIRSFFRTRRHEKQTATRKKWSSFG